MARKRKRAELLARWWRTFWSTGTTMKRSALLVVGALAVMGSLWASITWAVPLIRSDDPPFASTNRVDKLREDFTKLAGDYDRLRCHSDQSDENSFGLSRMIWQDRLNEANAALKRNGNDRNAAINKDAAEQRVRQIDKKLDKLADQPNCN